MTCSLYETGLTFRCHISEIPENFDYLHKVSPYNFNIVIQKNCMIQIT